MSKKYYRATELDKVVIEELDAFAYACTNDIHEAAIVAAKWAKKELEKSTPRNEGDLAKDWHIDRKKLRTGTKTTVYNGTYMLLHLLEHGHAKVNGGRTRAVNFIAPINTQAADKFEEELKRRVENGS